MKTKKLTLTRIALFVALAALLVNCATPPADVRGHAPVSAPDELAYALRDVSDYLNETIPAGSTIAILNIQSDSAVLSDYIIDELMANAVNDRIFTVVDRQQLDLIRAEQGFQWDGEVDDNTALEVGRFLGAQTMISGRFISLGGRYRLTIRALNVQTAHVQGMYNRNIAAGPRIAALMAAGGVRPAVPVAVAPGGRQPAAVGTTPTAPAPVAPAVPAVVVPDGATLLNVNNVAMWGTAINTIRNGGNNQTYVINVTGNISVPAPPANELLFGPVTGIKVYIRGTGTLALSVNGSLLSIGAMQEVVLRDVTLQGRSGNNNPLVDIRSGGKFLMEGRASVTGNRPGIIIHSISGGVHINGGTFVMENGTISGNYSGGHRRSAGVTIFNGTFIMQGGTISGNRGDSSGGVSLVNGTFTMEGGTISGNSGGGVEISGGTFTLSGGSISGNTTNYRNGAGVSVFGGAFIMEGGIISGNTISGNRGNGGGVFISRGDWSARPTFTKTGGTINGSDAGFVARNSANEQGHALFLEGSPNRWRNATAGVYDASDAFGFWLND